MCERILALPRDSGDAHRRFRFGKIVHFLNPRVVLRHGRLVGSVKVAGCEQHQKWRRAVLAVHFQIERPDSIGARRKRADLDDDSIECAFVFHCSDDPII